MFKGKGDRLTHIHVPHELRITVTFVIDRVWKLFLIKDRGGKMRLSDNLQMLCLQLQK